MARLPDKVVVEGPDGVFEGFSALTITNDIVGQTEATLEVGDDGAWPELERLVAPGGDFRVTLNGLPRLVGRAEVNEVPGSASSGVVLQLTVRTKMADAWYAPAPLETRVEGVSVKDFVVACYRPLGYEAGDFVFGSFVARDLMTGKAPGGDQPPIDLEPLKVDQAKIQPDETIRAAVERHLARFHATHWDAPDGRIVVGVPDDAQAPSYTLRAKRGPESRGNNVLSFKRLRDWTDVASSVTAFGKSAGKQSPRKGLRGVAVDEEVFSVAANTGHFQRAITVSNTEAKELSHAEAIAARELSARVRRKNAFELQADGWSFWNGSEQIPYATDTTCDLDIDALGTEAQGRYLIVRTILQLSAGMAATTQLAMVAPGIWVV